MKTWTKLMTTMYPLVIIATPVWADDSRKIQAATDWETANLYINQDHVMGNGVVLTYTGAQPTTHGYVGFTFDYAAPHSTASCPRKLVLIRGINIVFLNGEKWKIFVDFDETRLFIKLSMNKL